MVSIKTRKEATDILIKLGFLIPANELELYHGRASDGSDWQVDPNFNNAGDATGNMNVTGFPVLYTSSYETAAAFAKRRSSITKSLKQEVHPISFTKNSFYIFDITKTADSLNSNEKELLFEAMATLTRLPSSPALLQSDYSHYIYDATELIEKYIKENNKTLISLEDAEVLKQILAESLFKGTPSTSAFEFVDKIITANATKLALRNIPQQTIRCIMGRASENTLHFSGIKIPLDTEYVLSSLKKGEIIGVKSVVDSATLDKIIDTYSIFDLHAVQRDTTKQSDITFIETEAEKKEKAIQTLIKLGVIVDASELKLYHGRAGDGFEWKYDPNFDNTGASKMGHFNASMQKTFYVGDYEVARAYAEQRSTEGKGGVPEIHEISFESEKAYFIRDNIQSLGLSIEETNEAINALKVLTSDPVTLDLPVDFFHKEAAEEALKLIDQITFHLNKPIGEQNLHNIISAAKNNPIITQKFKTDKEIAEFIEKLVSSINTQRLIAKNSDQLLAAIKGNQSYLRLQGKKYIINPQYFKSWQMRHAIMGTAERKYSGTLGYDIDRFNITAMSKVYQTQHKQEKEALSKEKYSTISHVLSDISTDKSVADFISKASPSEMMLFLCQNDELKTLYNLPSGVWEGWSIGQHTESVLTMFDKYFDSDLPKELLPFMKLLLAAHDVGKGEAIRNLGIRSLGGGAKEYEKKFNLMKAEILCDYVDMPETTKNVFMFLMGEGKALIEDFVLANNYPRQPLLSFNKDRGKRSTNLQARFAQQLTGILGRTPSDQEILGLIDLCLILQSTDSGSYTTFGIVKSTEKVYCYGANVHFTGSFYFDERSNPRLKTPYTHVREYNITDL